MRGAMIGPMAKNLVRDQDLLLGVGAQTVLVPQRPSVPPIPSLVPCVSMWRAWASLVAAGLKPIETRTWAYREPSPGPVRPAEGAPFWLALHATAKKDGNIAGARRPLPEVPLVPIGVIFAIALVRRIRPLMLTDLPAAHVYCEGLLAWELERVTVLRPMVVIPRGFQKFGYIDGLALRGASAGVHLAIPAQKEQRDNWLRTHTGMWPMCSIDYARDCGPAWM